MKKAMLAPLILVLMIGLAQARSHIFVKGLRHASYESYTRIVVDLNGPASFNQGRLKNPDRIFFDLKNCSLSQKIKSSLPVDDRVLKSIRIAQFRKDIVRVVFDLRNMKNFSAFTLEAPYRLVIDVYAGETDNDQPHKNRKKPDNKKHEEIKDIRAVVIDPGHGGKDPGAVGPRGLKEKDIALSVGKKLGRILKNRYGMNIIYTRKSDIFVPLNDRTEIANSSKADLFISIHTNASRTRNARGIETYFLNWTNNSEAIRVAARENRISIRKMRKVQNGLQMILQDLARKNKNEESMRLAHSVQNSMVSTLEQKYRNIEDLGVKYALFYVLVGAEMPSVLAEISFISNHEEEKRLSKAEYRNRIAEAIANGVNSYVNQSTLIVKRSGVAY